VLTSPASQNTIKDKMVKKNKEGADRKSISVYVSQDIYQALRKYCFDNEIAHTEFLGNYWLRS